MTLSDLMRRHEDLTGVGAAKEQPAGGRGETPRHRLTRGLRIAQVVVGAWALGIDLPLPYDLAIMPTIILLTLLPISIAAGRPGAWMYARSGLKLA